MLLKPASREEDPAHESSKSAAGQKAPFAAARNGSAVARRANTQRRRPSVDLSTLFVPCAAAKARAPRPYQDEAVHALLAALERPAFSILVLPTGSGKTFVANEVVHRIAQNGRVVWLALNWELIVQAGSGYAQRYDGVDTLARKGGAGSPLRNVLLEDEARRIQYTTLHTWYRRRGDQDLAADRVKLLVIDECHWGMNGAMGRALFARYLGRVPILGLSATPRHVTVPAGSEPARIAYRKTFADLEGKYLASPRLETPLTGRTFRLQLASTGDFSERSVAALAADPERNELICRTLLSGVKSNKYTRVMIFACNVEHANCLASMLSRHGIDARALHYEVSSEQQRAQLIADFKRGAFNVIINVAMLTHGVDVPDVDAVFLTRPTASAALCSQMVGRGARLIEGKKDQFWVVEFTDNLEQHGEAVFRARELLPLSVAKRPTRSERALPTRHLPPPEHPRFLRLMEPTEIAGLTYVEDQTFGVEIELTSPLGPPDRTGLVPSNWRWKLVASEIISAIASVATLPVDPEPRNYHEVHDTDRWRVEFDRSAGWEVVSPILSNREGFAELVQVMSAIHALTRESEAVHVNHRTGLHVTLGSAFVTDEQVQGLVRLTQRLEPGLFTLVSPSRLFSFEDGHYALRAHNRYCLPLRELPSEVTELGLSSFTGPDPLIRYRTVNLSHVGREDQHIEIRMHNGTTRYPVVVAWISLWMTLLNRARFQWPSEGAKTPVFPGGNVAIDREQALAEDLFALLQQVDVHIDPRLGRELARRRTELLGRWRKVLPRRVEAWRACWPAYVGESDAQ